MSVRDTFILLILIALSYVSNAQADQSSLEKKIIKTYNDEMYEYNSRYNTLVPIIDQRKFSNNHVVFFIDKSQLQDHLSINQLGDSYLYLDGQLYKHFQDKGEEILLISDLFYSTNNDTIKCSLYSEKFNGVLPLIHVFKTTGWQERSSVSTVFAYISRYNAGGSLDVIFVLLVVVFFAFVKMNDSVTMNAYFNVSKFIRNAPVEDYIIQRSFSFQALIYIVFVVATISLVITNRYMYFDFFRIEINTLYQSYLINSLILLVFFVIKYLIFYVTGNFLGERQLSKIHYFEFIRFFCITCVLLIFLNFYDLGNSSIFINIVYGLIVLWLLRLYFVLASLKIFKNVFLICYICTTEIVPLVLLFNRIAVFKGI